MKILIIGSGGREHALGWKLKQSPDAEKLYFAPGNGGTCNLGENVDITADDIKNLFAFAQKNAIDLTVVGPEAPLVDGIVDVFQKHGLKIFGPSQKASRLEGSKIWAAEFLRRHKIPSPLFSVFDRADKAETFVRKNPWQNLVIKADGLAGGKGVLIPHSQKEAIDAVKTLMVEKKFGRAGEKIVIQEKLEGQEVSVIGFCDGNTIIPLLPTQDHKRINDGDRGLNTGGMGAYAPVPFVDSQLMKTIYHSILLPTITDMKKEGMPYTGILYAGLILTKSGPKVLEFNVRFGDPETQPQLMLLKSDLLTIIEACITGILKEVPVLFHRGSSACVVLTAKGYPGDHEKGKVIYGFENVTDSNTQVFHAGTAKINGQVVTSGGRVLGVTAMASSLPSALKKAYEVIGKKGVYFSGMHYRKDIGQKALTVNR